jgi:hypothetical protein
MPNANEAQRLTEWELDDLLQTLGNINGMLTQDLRAETSWATHFAQSHLFQTILLLEARKANCDAGN